MNKVSQCHSPRLLLQILLILEYRMKYRYKGVEVGMLRTLITIFFFGGYGLITIPKYIYMRLFIKNPEMRKIYSRQVVLKWINSLWRGSKSTLVVKGQENIPEGAALYVANHQSMIDIPALYGSIQGHTGFVAKKELKKVPLVSHWINETPSVYIDRKDIRQSIQAIITATKNLKEGNNIAIFPEGTRSQDGKVHAFKKGSLKPAIKTGVPIIPVALENTEKLLGDLKKKFKVRPQEIRVTFLEPIYYNELCEEDKKNINIILQERIGAFVNH